MRDELDEFIQSCLPCARYTWKKEGYHPSRSVEADRPWDHIEIDLIGPIVASRTGHSYILTVVDVLSGYTVLRALVSSTKEAVARELWMIFCDYGTPRIIQSDNGTEFVNEVIEAISKLYGVERRLVVPYHPQANGAVERRNKDVGQVLKKLVEGNFEEWNLWLPHVQLSINTQVQIRTGSTPMSVMFGRDFHGFLNFEDTKEVEQNEKLDNAVQLWRKLMTFDVWPALSERSKEHKIVARQALDSARKLVEPFKVGESVMVLNVNKEGKFDQLYEGPYEVERVTAGGNYILKDVLGQVLERRFTPFMLQHTRSMAVPSGEGMVEKDAKIQELTEGKGRDDKFYQVQKILKHKKVGSNTFIIADGKDLDPSMICGFERRIFTAI